MNFTPFPRRRYVTVPTPLEPMPGLSAALGGKVDLWIKRDDLLPGAAGGNKTRKLEFAIGKAIAEGADTLITCGAPQSNHCRLTLSWANNEGLDCHLILKESTPGAYDPKASGNIFLFHLMQPTSIGLIGADDDYDEAMEKKADELKAEGKRPYVIPMGASDAIGALGYARFADELMTQVNERGLDVERIFVPAGSAGTQAGIVTGFAGNSCDIPVYGINILSPSKEEQENKVYDLAAETADLLSVTNLRRESVICVDGYLGQGYAIPTEAMKEAVFLFARKEGILLDPVYSGKTAAGLIDFVRQGKIAAGSTVIFVHTGGSPALYTQKDFFY